MPRAYKLVGRELSAQTTVSRSAVNRRLTSFCYGTCPMLGRESSR
nr:MAG TPA: HTH domain protein [Caudoviricetes sp.]